MTLPLAPNDPRVHIFALDPDAPKLAPRSYLTPPAAEPGAVEPAEAFGAAIDPTYVEVFPVADVAPMGLRAYLSQAHDIPGVVLAQDAARLDALGGSVAILAPRAVRGLDALDPAPGLRHVGSYAIAGADDAPRDLPPAASRPRPRTPPAPASNPMSRLTIGWVVAIGLVLAGIVLLWL